MDKIKELILKNKKRIAAVLTVLVILCIAFFAGEPLSKNKSKKLPISQFDSLVRKLENEILKQKILEKNKQQTA